MLFGKHEPSRKYTLTAMDILILNTHYKHWPLQSNLWLIPCLCYSVEFDFWQRLASRRCCVGLRFISILVKSAHTKLLFPCQAFCISYSVKSSCTICFFQLYVPVPQTKQWFDIWGVYHPKCMEWYQNIPQSRRIQTYFVEFQPLSVWSFTVSWATGSVWAAWESSSPSEIYC